MSTMNPVASFFASLGIKVDQRSFAQADRMLKNIQSTMEGFKKYQANLVIKPKISFNSLTLQRDIQKSMNQVAKLTQFKIDKFNIDASRLTSSLESAIRRAQHSAGSIKVRAIAERSPLSQSTRALVRQHEAGLAANGGAGGVGGFIAASRAGLLGVGSYVGYQGIQQINDQINGVQDRVIRTDTARMLLGQSVGGSETRKTNALDYYRQTTNKYGTDAEGGIRDFNSLLVNQRMAGTSTRDALRNWELIQERATFAHLGADQQQRFIRQLLQIQGKNQVTQEDLSTIADSDSGFKSTLIQSYAKTKGWSGNMQDWSVKYADDQKKGLVKWQDVVNALILSSQRYSREIEESSNSLRADAQRTANSKFWADMERNSEELTKTLEERNKAEQELYAAAVPLQQLFTKLVEIPVVERLTDFTKSLTGFADWYNKYQKLPEDKKTDAAIDVGENVAWWVGKRLAKNNLIGTAVENNWLGMGDGADWLQRFVLGPQQGEPGRRIVPDFKAYQPPKLNYQVPYGDFQMPAMLPPAMPPQFGSSPLQHYQQNNDNAVQQLMNQSYTNNNTNNNDYSIRIEPGAIVINGSDLSVQDISRELESQMKSIAERVQYNTISETIVNYPSIGR
ncbi:hypothetical protein SB11R_00170 [Pseudomonas oryzihabitans]|nr:hypothetical protein SB11R_00170 [Pseudomonas psychrotolerans]